MKQASSSLASTLYSFTALTMLGFIIIICRLAYFQLHLSSIFLHQSKHNYLRYEYIPSPRGTIVDCHDTPLATNRPIISLIWHGTGNKSLSTAQQNDLNAISNLLSISIDYGAIKACERKQTDYVIIQDISFEKLSTMLEAFPEHGNLRCETEFQRYYPHHELACHVLGYITTTQQQQHGVMGLEKACNLALNGVPGQQLTTINSFGQQIEKQRVQQALVGETIKITIDINLQKIAEEVFPENTKGAMIIMDAKTGALRVLLSRPAFDPNAFTNQLSHTDWQQLLIDQAFLNRVFFACYPPASLFKLVVMAAALDTNLITPDETWYCPGFSVFCGRPYACMNRKAHGHVNIEDAITKSCNIPFYEIARHIRINTLATYAHFLGLGSGTQSILGEKTGLIPTTQWKLSVMGEPWWPGETLSASIGQTYTLITPIQACRMIATICEGYSATPHLLEGSATEKIVPPIRPQVLKLIKESMRWVVVRGTGQQLKGFHDMIIYAKTGTAQTRNLNPNNPLVSEKTSLGWFGAHITYKNDPSLVLVILIEQVYSSKESAQVAKKFIKKYQQHVDGKI